MTKYTIVGFVNLLVGSLQTINFLFTIFITLPRLTELYSEFAAQRPSFMSTYLRLGFTVLLGISNFFFGFTLISKSEKKIKYFRYALILAIISIPLGVIFINIASILPVYNLTSPF